MKYLHNSINIFQSQIMYLADGTEAPFVHWHPSYPKAESDRNTVSLGVHAKGSEYNGMQNIPSAHLVAAILCQIHI